MAGRPRTRAKKPKKFSAKSLEILRKAGIDPNNPKAPLPEVVEGEVIGTYESPEHKPENATQAVRYINGQKKPPVQQRKTYEQKQAMLESYGIGFSQYRFNEEIPPATDEKGQWSKERDEQLFAFLSNGGMVTTWLRAAGLSNTVLYTRKAKDPEFAAKYDKARELGADAMAEEALRIASTPQMTTDTVETVLADGGIMRAAKTYDNVYARKLAFQARLQLLAKWQPDKYGDKIAVNVNDSRAQQILEARKRLLGR